MINLLKDIPFFRREFAKVWRNGYNAGFRDSDAVTEWCYDGEQHRPHPKETLNPYGDI